MGAWGTAIFSDDVACDIRDLYRDHIGDGLRSPEATREVLNEYASALNDPNDGPVIWLALAATQWKCGRLEEDVKARALEIIDSGAGLALWEEQGPKLLGKRQTALQKLKEQLTSPQPPPKRIPKRFRNSTDLKAGEVIGYRLPSGRLVLFHVVGFHTDRGGTCPRLVLLNWSGDRAPSRWRIALMKPMRPRTGLQERSELMVGALKEGEYPADRISVVAQGLRIRTSCACYTQLWRWLDRWLEEHYGLV